MGTIRCLNCGNELTLISGMECPNCKTPLSHVKIAFLSYLGPSDSLSGYQRSYKLVLLKSIFESIQEHEELTVRRITDKFANYYLLRAKAGMIVDKDVDVHISEIEKSTPEDIWNIIKTNPYAAIAKHNFLKINGEGYQGTFILQKGIDNLNATEIKNILELLSQKLKLYYNKIGSDVILAEEIISEEVNPISDSSIEKTTIIDGTTPLEQVELSTRAYNALKRANINTYGELCVAFSEGKVESIRNIGKQVMDELSAIIGSPVVKADQKEAEIAFKELFDNSTPLDEVVISIRSLNALNQGGITSLGELAMAFSSKKLSKIKNVGPAVIEEAKRILENPDSFTNPSSEFIDNLIDEFSSESAFDIVVNRAEGKTLQTVADERGLTRERIRQVCNKTCLRLRPLANIITKNLMATNGGHWFRKEQLYEYVINPTYAKAIEFTIEENGGFYLVASELWLEKEFYPECENRLKALIEEIVGEGINFFEASETVEKHFEKAGFECLGADDFLGMLIEFDYKFYGDYVLKDKKSYAFLCSKIVEDIFPDGISFVDEDLAQLRKVAMERFGDLDLPESNRSLFARLCEHLILRGRSQYIAPSKVYVEKEILADIIDYIDNCKQKDIFYNELYAEFEGLLMMMTNIDNPQFLHGVLRYYYPANYSYNRDYLSKETGEAGQSLADRITSFVTSKGQAVTKNEILRNFPGISDVVLFNTAYQFRGLLLWEYNYYNSLNNLHWDENHIMSLGSLIVNILNENNGYCSDAMLYERAEQTIPNTLRLANIKNSQNLFYSVQEIFEGEFTFRNPHISFIGRFENLTGIDVAKDFFATKNKFTGTEFYAMADRFKWPAGTVGSIFTEIEKDFVRVAADVYIRRSSLEFTDDDIDYIETLLKEESAENWYLPLQQFADSEDVTPSGHPINEFLIGSIIGLRDFGWHIVSPQFKDRRYQKGILVKNEFSITAYDELVSTVLKEQNVESLSENDLLSFLMIRSLSFRYVPKDLKTSPLFNYSEGMFIVK